MSRDPDGVPVRHDPRARRELAIALLVGVAGAGLVLLAASRTWLVETTVRAAPQPPLTLARTGASMAPLIPALALVALAGAGAVLATRSSGRLGVGVLMVLAAAALTVDAVRTIPAVSGARATWPVLCVVGGVACAGAGLLTVWRGRNWPAMGARYENRIAGADAPADRPDAATARLWDAIDRGLDPTAGTE